MKIRVNISLKKAVLDTQGKAIESALVKNLGYNQISNVRQGKFVDLEIKADTVEEATKIVDEIADKLLVNKIIEDYNFEILKEIDLSSNRIEYIQESTFLQCKTLKNINLIKNTSFKDDLIEGYTKKITPVHLFTPKNSFTEDFVYSIDIEYLKKTLNKDIYPLLIIQTSPNNKDIISNDYEIHITNNHLQYAITWYGLALFTIIFFLYYRKKA